MKAIIGLALALVSICSSLTSSPSSLVTQAFLIVFVLTADLAMGALAIRAFRQVSRKVAALTRKAVCSTSGAGSSDTLGGTATRGVGALTIPRSGVSNE